LHRSIISGYLAHAALFVSIEHVLHIGDDIIVLSLVTKDVYPYGTIVLSYFPRLKDIG
jgi:Tfp pilus assembly protein PilZ